MSALPLPVAPGSASPIAEPLLAWFDHAGRKHLPWQRDPTPYRVWVSEIMLQQTQVATVIDYYTRFMARFADVHALAAASVDEVLHLWTGLGYYARARNLHRAARIIVAEHGGEFPRQIERVRALPGIGRSTAGAILALADAQRHPILDGNVKRVLTRHFGIDGFPGERSVEEQLWALAAACTPLQRVAHYTQAIMDLGATVCVRSRPLCAVCPLTATCTARHEGRQAVLPAARPKRARPQRVAYVVIATRDDGAVLLERRPPTGIWGGLWTLPQFDDRASAQSWVGPGLNVCAIEADWPAYRHSFTHFDLTLHPLLVRVAATPAVWDAERYCWYHTAAPAKIGLAKPALDLIQRLAELGRPPAF